MTARRLVENCVQTNQTAVVDEMLNKHLLPAEYIYPFIGDVMEWWLIDRRLAERLKRKPSNHRRPRLPLVGTDNQRTGNLHGRRDTEDCRRVKLGLHIDIAKCKLQRLGVLQFREDFATSNFCFCVGVKSRNAESNDLQTTIKEFIQA